MNLIQEMLDRLREGRWEDVEKCPELLEASLQEVQVLREILDSIHKRDHDYLTPLDEKLAELLEQSDDH